MSWLHRVMGETRMLEHEVPIVFNRESDLFRSYLEQRRTPRKVDFANAPAADAAVPDTLFREDTGVIKSAASAVNHVENIYHHDDGDTPPKSHYHQPSTT